MSIFDDLFVLELANNHDGDVHFGLRIIREHAAVVKEAGVRAAIKLQVRRPGFVHEAYRHRADLRYVRRSVEAALRPDEYLRLAEAVRKEGLLLGATPFDEESVEFCVRDLHVDLLKIASSDIDDRILIDSVTRFRTPVIASTAGASEDSLIHLAKKVTAHFALNHCVALYPTPDDKLDLHQITWLASRFPGAIIGLSSHERTLNSMLLSYALGARTWERHIDVESCCRLPAAYCSTPSQIAEWFTAYKKAKAMCGEAAPGARRVGEREAAYLAHLRRGWWAARDLPAGHQLGAEDCYLAIPVQPGQADHRHIIVGLELLGPVAKDGPIPRP